MGEALQELNIISGKQGEYGLYIKTVNGITADCDKDKTYRAFYCDGEYSNLSADFTNINPGSRYMLKIEKI